MRRDLYVKNRCPVMWIAVFCYSIIGVYCFYLQHRISFFVNAKFLKPIKMSINYLINQMKEGYVRQK